MTYAELLDAFEGAHSEVFRLEVQQSYAGVPDPGWEAWKAGRSLPTRTADTDEWLAKTAAKIAAGVRWIRVIVVDWPLDEYLRYALAAYEAHVAVGEKVYVVDRDVDPALASLVDDFWMIDEEFVAIMRFDAEHRPVGPAAPQGPVDKFIARRDLVLANASSLSEWVADHREQLSA
ncbi:MAG: hypothetical protein GEU78_17710 [Actinobacteria bacterium]|nr:hypothetical protein [Actinomycetota bacterium]